MSKHIFSVNPIPLFNGFGISQPPKLFSSLIICQLCTTLVTKVNIIYPSIILLKLDLKVRLIEILSPLTFSILLLVISYTSVLTTMATAQVNSIETNLVEAVQESSHNSTDYLRAKILIKGVELSAEIPTTQELMGKGLAVKNELKENESMLFVFDKPEKHSFWMKDMKFPIDIIWLDSNGKVVHIEEKLEPCPLAPICSSYPPSADSQYVLETVAGFIQRNNISVGTNIDIELVR